MWGVCKLVQADWLIVPFLRLTGLRRGSSLSQPCTQGSTTLFYSWRLDTSLTRLSSSAKWVSESSESQSMDRPLSSVPFELLVQPQVPVEPRKCVEIQVAKVLKFFSSVKSRYWMLTLSITTTMFVFCMELKAY